MFGRKKQKQRKTTRIDTLIGENTHIKGDVHFSGGLRIDGVISGNIHADDGEPALLTLSEKGRIDGDVRVPYQVINGVVKGSIYAAEHIELAAKARINGHVYYKLLEVAVGSQVNGALVHVDDTATAELSVDHSDNTTNLHPEQKS